MKGSCFCGGIVFEYQEAVGPFELCHCSRCRKVSGSSHTAAVMINRESYSLVQGQELIRTYTAPIVNEPPAYEVQFCSRCGSNLPVPDGELIEIPAGLLDDDPGLCPQRHIYIDYKANWDQIDVELPKLTKSEIREYRHNLKSSKA